MTPVTKPTRKPAMGGAAGLMLALPVALASMTPMAATALPSACDAVSGNLVANCGFETGGSWSAILSSMASAHTGSRSLLLGYNSSILATEQSVATLAGTTYSLSFWAKRIFSAFAFDVYFDGAKIGSYGGGPAFTEATASVTASSSTSILRFVATGAYGYIDDVVLLAPTQTDVPEPASLAVLGAGLAGLAGLGRRRRRTA